MMQSAVSTKDTDSLLHISSVAVVVVCYNDRGYMEACLSRILAQERAPDRIVVVDNASTDGSADFIRDRFGGAVQVIESAENGGYCAAIDQAVQQLDTDYVAVLNPDTEPGDAWLEPLVSFLDEHPEAGAVTSRILLTKQPERLNALGLQIHVAGMGFNRSMGELDTREAVVPFRVDGIHGASFLGRRVLLAQITPIVRDCFLYHDDVQISWLLQLMGQAIYCVPRSIVHHDYELHMFPHKLRFLERNRLEMLAFVLEASSFWRYLPVLVLTEAMVFAYAALRGPQYLRAKVGAFEDVWRRREGVLRKRRMVKQLRVVGDRDFLPGLRKGYVWSQLALILRQTNRKQAWATAMQAKGERG